MNITTNFFAELCFGLKLEAQSNPVSEIHEATELYLELFMS